MHITETRENWTLTNDNGSMVAEVGPTFLRQPKHVLLYPGCPAEQREEALTFASRRMTNLTSWETNMTPSELLKERGVQALDLAFHTSAEAIAAAVELAGIPGLRARLGRIPWSDDREVVFRIGRTHRFEFWKSVSVPQDPNSTWVLHLVPAYHPKVMGAKEHGLINGDTDCNIRDNTVRYVMCPDASSAGREIKFKGSSWSHVKHPFVAVGRSLNMRVSENNVRTSAGVEALAAYLRAALRLDNRYIGVSGGFRAPLEHPTNYLRVPYNSCRGSEESCVWEYRVLQREGTLSAAFVPPWFIKEGWLAKYAGATERHGAH